MLARRPDNTVGERGAGNTKVTHRRLCSQGTREYSFRVVFSRGKMYNLLSAQKAGIRGGYQPRWSMHSLQDLDTASSTSKTGDI